MVKAMRKLSAAIDGQKGRGHGPQAIPAARLTAGMNRGAWGSLRPENEAEDMAFSFSEAKISKKVAVVQPFFTKSLSVKKKRRTFAAAFRNHRSIRHRDRCTDEWQKSVGRML